MMIAAIACICACEKTETPVETFETNMHKLYGEYRLSDIHWTYPGYTGSDDPFLSNIENLSLFVKTFDENSFKIGILCTLPHNDPNGLQTLAENYLYYTFTRK